MIRPPQQVPLVQAARLGAALVFLLTACLPLTTIEPVDTFDLEWAGTSDTISPYGPVRTCFTSPVRHPDSVLFTIRPLFTEYRQQNNESADTFTLELLQPLQGAARYTLRLAQWIESVEASFLSPGSDSIVFYTWPIEQEPNNGMTTADTLGSIVFGSIASANDTDWYAVSDSAAQAFYLKSTGSSSLFEIRDALGSIQRPLTFTATRTLSVPREFVRPLHILVYPYNRSNGGVYELGAVRP
ncbi:MAG: hypothetical protein JXA71_12680 [Chitinispirillaceae bacterium]|nr:hypothetical protein [Chitinispirillaceae bacterium]